MRVSQGDWNAVARHGATLRGFSGCYGGAIDAVRPRPIEFLFSITTILSWAR